MKHAAMSLCWWVKTSFYKSSLCVGNSFIVKTEQCSTVDWYCGFIQLPCQFAITMLHFYHSGLISLVFDTMKISTISHSY